MANNRRESAQSINAFTDQLLKLTQMNEQKLEKVRDVVETRLRALQEDNSQKLERMRETVDEKLHSTLEKRLGESLRWSANGSRGARRLRRDAKPRFRRWRP